MKRYLGIVLLFPALLAVSSCAGKPEEISEDTVTELEQAPAPEMQVESETADLLPEDDRENTDPTDTPESAGDSGAEPDKPAKAVAEPNRKKTDERPVVVKNVAAKPSEEAPAPEDYLMPEIPMIEEIPEPIPAPEEKMVPINPLLVADKPADIAPEPEPEPVFLPLPEPEPEPEQVEFTESPPIPLNDPAVSAASPSRILEEPGEFTITLEGLGWIFRSDLSTAGSWRFLERDLDGNSTHFRFMFTETGDWNLVFERQDLSSGGSESAVRNVVVNDAAGGAVIDNGPLPESSDNPISGNMPADAESRNDAAEAAVSEGKISEAMEFWEQNASGDDDAARRARASLIENAAATGALGPLVTWLPAYLDDNPNPDTLASALDSLEGQAGYDSESLSILEKLAVMDNGSRRPEWLYRLASYLEKPGTGRDLDRAAALYQEVISRWPLTEWRDLSEERLLWLQRHYFRVR